MLAQLLAALACRILPIAGPVCLQSCLAFSANLVSLAFVGHLGSLTLSQAVLGLSCYNVTGYSMLLGLATGMETLCGQVSSHLSRNVSVSRQHPVQNRGSTAWFYATQGLHA